MVALCISQNLCAVKVYVPVLSNNSSDSCPKRRENILHNAFPSNEMTDTTELLGYLKTRGANVALYLEEENGKGERSVRDLSISVLNSHQQDESQVGCLYICPTIRL